MDLRRRKPAAGRLPVTISVFASLRPYMPEYLLAGTGNLSSLPRNTNVPNRNQKTAAHSPRPPLSSLCFTLECMPHAFSHPLQPCSVIPGSLPNTNVGCHCRIRAHRERSAYYCSTINLASFDLHRLFSHFFTSPHPHHILSTSGLQLLRRSRNSSSPPLVQPAMQSEPGPSQVRRPQQRN